MKYRNSKLCPLLAFPVDSFWPWIWTVQSCIQNMHENMGLLYKAKNLTHEPSRRSVALEGNSNESGSHVVTPISTLPLHELICKKLMALTILTDGTQHITKTWVCPHHHNTFPYTNITVILLSLTLASCWSLFITFCYQNCVFSWLLIWSAFNSWILVNYLTMLYKYLVIQNSLMVKNKLNEYL
jgi:hypothetical protein